MGCRGAVVSTMDAHLLLMVQAVLGVQIALAASLLGIRGCHRYAMSQLAKEMRDEVVGRRRQLHDRLALEEGAEPELVRPVGVSGAKPRSPVSAARRERAVFRAILKLQAMHRAKRARARTALLAQLRQYRALARERRLVLASVYLAVALVFGAAGYMSLLFGVKFNQEQRVAWVEAVAIALAWDVGVQSPLAVLGETLYERYILRAVASRTWFVYLAMCMVKGRHAIGL